MIRVSPGDAIDPLTAEDVGSSGGKRMNRATFGYASRFETEHHIRGILLGEGAEIPKLLDVQPLMSAVSRNCIRAAHLKL